MKKWQKNVIIYLITIILLMFISYFLADFTIDDVWNYGFSYNIKNGQVPYKDFNMILGPFYNFIIAKLMIFNNSLISYHLANSIILSLIIVPIYQKIGHNYLYLILLLLILPVMFSYNTFIAFLIILILLIHEKNNKNKDFIIGLIIGTIFITKQNIGLVLVTIHFFISKEKKKTFLSFTIPLLILIIYLIYHNTLISYIDFCFLGLGNFMDNLMIETPILIFEIAIILYLLNRYYLTKDEKIIYLLGFQMINFPILDCTHFIVGIIPILYYILSNNHKNYLNLFSKAILISASIGFILQNIPFTYAKENTFIKYRHIEKNIDTYLLEMSNYVKEKEKNNKVYLFIANSYLIRINLKENLSVYDLINKGNLGKNPSKYLNNIKKECSNTNCLFIIDYNYFQKNKNNQLDPLFKHFVINNYDYLETLPSKDKVYTSKKK